MIKKLIALLLASVMCLALCACGGSSPEPTPEPEPTPVPSNWSVGIGVDEFGDPTDESCIIGKFTGKFSNSATTGSELDVSVLCIKVDGQYSFIFRLLENGQFKPGFAAFDDITLKTKINGDVQSHEVVCFEHGGELYFGGNDSELKMILTDNVHKVSCVIEYEGSKYNFVIDGQGFAEALAEFEAKTGSNVGSKQITSVVCDDWNNIYILYEDGSVKSEAYMIDTSSWENITAVAAGDSFVLGLQDDGTVIADGENEDGQCDVEGWTDIVAIAAGAYHSLGLKKDGTVVAAGYNEGGQCDVDEWSDIVAIAAGARHSLGLRKDGTVVAAGYNTDGQCDVDDWTDVEKIFCQSGCFTSFGIKKDGTILAAGYDENYNYNSDKWSDVVYIASGSINIAGLRSDGTVVVVGEENDYGQCDTQTWTGMDFVISGWEYTLGVRADGTWVFTGDNYYKADIAKVFE